MSRIKSVMRRLVKPLMLVVVLISGVVFGLYKMRVNIPLVNTTKIYASLDSVGVRAAHLKGRVVGLYESYFHKHSEEAHQEHHKTTVTSPLAEDVIITQDYVCQIRSRRYIEVCALEKGYLQAITIKEGQPVKEGEVMFKVVPTLYKASWDAEVAEKNVAKMEAEFASSLAAKNAVSKKEVLLYNAKLAKAQAKADQAEAELNFATIKAPFDGIIDRLKAMQGSLVKEGDVLTTLSDNNVMWVYFYVTEKRYFEYMQGSGQKTKIPNIELVLANHEKFPQLGEIDQTRNIGAIEANFNPETGNIPFRADFPNPDGLLRHGQTGTVLIKRKLKNALVIPQRATFENLAKRYAYVVDKDDVVHQREIVIDYVLDDIFVIGKGLDVNDKIILEGIREVRDGEKVEYVFRKPEEVMQNMKYHAE